MKTQIHKLEHSAVIIEYAGHRLAIDPGSLTSDQSRQKLKGVEAVLVTHQHGDHFDVATLREIGATVFGPPDVATLAKEAKLHGRPLNVNVSLEIGGITARPVPANHGPAVTTPIANYGFVISAGGKRIYVTGDLAGEQAEIPLGPFDLVALPVEGGGFVFDPVEATAFLRAMSHHGYAMPLHADESAAAQEEFRRSVAEFCKPVVLGVGEELVL
jgi:L-ascorbate metabolism protein UlaG (beta-lactamase superfamily)